MRDVKRASQQVLDAYMTEAYTQGLADLWHAVRVLLLKPEDGGLTQAEYMSLFIEDNTYNVLLREDPQNLIDKIQAWEQCKADSEIHRGDEVFYQGKRGIVLRPETDRRYAGVWLAGEEYVSARHSWLYKTGKAYPEVATALDEMRAKR